MNQKSIFFLIIFILLNTVMYAQKSKIYCSKGCDSLDISLVDYGLNLKTRKDSIRSFHLKADIYYSYFNDFSGCVTLLEKVHVMDSLYISKNFSFYLEFKKRHPKLQYFVSYLPQELLEVFVDEDYLREHAGSTSKRDVSGIFQEMQDRDQKFRIEITEHRIKLDNEEIDGLRKDSVQNIIDSLWEMQTTEDEINYELLKGIESEKYSILFKEINPDEMNVLFTVFLHSGNRLQNLTTLLDYLYIKEKLTYESYFMIVGRSYVDSLGKSPIASFYGETDTSLLPKLKDEYPLFYDEILKRER